MKKIPKISIYSDQIFKLSCIVRDIKGCPVRCQPCKLISSKPEIAKVKGYTIHPTGKKHGFTDITSENPLLEGYKFRVRVYKRKKDKAGREIWQ